MTEIPEHLLKRAQAARDKAAVEGGATGEAAVGAAAATGGDAWPIRAFLRTCSSAARCQAAGSGGGVAVQGRRWPAWSPLPHGRQPAGRGRPRRPHPTPAHRRQERQHPRCEGVTGRQQGAHLAAPAGYRVCALRSACLSFTFFFSIFVNAPLLQQANINKTPNPSKAPWYFLGLQELLTMFHPMIAGVTIPGVGMIVLILAPYIDKNPSNKPEDRKFARR